MMTPHMMNEKKKEMEEESEEPKKEPELKSSDEDEESIGAIILGILLVIFFIVGGLSIIVDELIMSPIEAKQQVVHYHEYAETIVPDVVGVYPNSGTKRDTDWFVLQASGEMLLIEIEAGSDGLAHTEQSVNQVDPVVKLVLEDAMRGNRKGWFRR